MNRPLIVDLKTAADEILAGAVGVEILKAAIFRGTLPAKRTTPADPASGKKAAGKYLIRVADLEAWFDKLDQA